MTDEIQKCRACHGKKVLVSGGQPCMTCNGTGEHRPCKHCGKNLNHAYDVTHGHRCFGLVASETAEPARTFAELCKMHDASYAYSDDGGTYRAGAKQREIMEQYAAKYLPWEAASKIFRDVCGHHVGVIRQY